MSFLISPKTGVIEQPYMVVDAALGVFLRTIPSLQKYLYRRGEISAGSSRHYILGTDKEVFLSVDLHALTATKTLIQCNAGIIIKQQASAEEIEEIERCIPGGLVDWIEILQTEEWPIVQALSVFIVPLDTFSQQTAKRGRKVWPEDEKAYAALRNGTPREVVFQEWLRSLSERRAIKDPRDSFRHAMRAQELRTKREE